MKNIWTKNIVDHNGPQAPHARYTEYRLHENVSPMTHVTLSHVFLLDYVFIPATGIYMFFSASVSHVLILRREGMA